jgi:hypothetical protein
MMLTTHHVNQLCLRASGVDGQAARNELLQIASASPTTNWEAEAVRVAQRWAAGQLDVAAANQPNGRRKKKR